ncbi:hypothetical protein XENOCAPTIV_011348 [Xenoophorus captivus]|uniref:Uncharacterized protein n=1 Tax=Xenoophorus captivus TaxID=1517983 RepID=A0ABV0RU24_9TELE
MVLVKTRLQNASIKSNLSFIFYYENTIVPTSIDCEKMYTDLSDVKRCLCCYLYWCAAFIWLSLIRTQTRLCHLAAVPLFPHIFPSSSLCIYQHYKLRDIFLLFISFSISFIFASHADIGLWGSELVHKLPKKEISTSHVCFFPTSSHTCGCN